MLFYNRYDRGSAWANFTYRLFPNIPASKISNKLVLDSRGENNSRPGSR